MLCCVCLVFVVLGSIVRTSLVWGGAPGRTTSIGTLECLWKIPSGFQGYSLHAPLPHPCNLQLAGKPRSWAGQSSSRSQLVEITFSGKQTQEVTLFSFKRFSAGRRTSGREQEAGGMRISAWSSFGKGVLGTLRFLAKRLSSTPDFCQSTALVGLSVVLFGFLCKTYWCAADARRIRNAGIP